MDVYTLHARTHVLRTCATRTSCASRYLQQHRSHDGQPEQHTPGIKMAVAKKVYQGIKKVAGSFVSSENFAYLCLRIKTFGMVTQKMISFKIDQKLLGHLDNEVYRTGRSRNSLINLSVNYFLNYLQLRRDYLLHPDDDSIREDILMSFEKRYFDDAPYL